MQERSQYVGRKRINYSIPVTGTSEINDHFQLSVKIRRKYQIIFKFRGKFLTLQRLLYINVGKFFISQFLLGFSFFSLFKLKYMEI